MKRIFGRKSCAVKNWHERALMIDPNKTRIIIVKTKTAKQIPQWVYKKYAAQKLLSN